MLKRAPALAILIALVTAIAHSASPADAAELSTNRDAPTPLASPTVAGRQGASATISYYVGFQAGPGEVRLTLDVKGPTGGRTIRVTVFDRDANDLGNVWVVATEREERRVLSVDVPAKQPVVAQITIDAGGPRTDVAYRIQVAGAVELATPGTVAALPAPRTSREVTIARSTDRDAPTPLTAPTVVGRQGASAAVSYYFGFQAGPGEVRLTLDAKGPSGGRTIRVSVFDRDARDLGNVWVVATEREERRVLRLDVASKQPLVAQITIDAGGPRTDVAYRLQAAGAVELATAGAATASPPPRESGEVTATLSTDRDAPTPLTSQTVEGRQGASAAVSYYVGFQAGPGEVRLTLDATGPRTGRRIRVSLFDRNARELRNVRVVAAEREERRVLRLDVPSRQPLVAQIAIDAGSSRTDLIYRIQVEGAVERAGPPPAVAAPVTPPTPPAPPAPTGPGPTVSRGEFSFKVTYRVSGSAEQVNLTYRDAQGATQQTSAKLPWQHTFDARGGSFLYVSAQNKQNWGAVTCEILIDGETRTNSTSSGAFVIAECSNAADRR